MHRLLSLHLVEDSGVSFLTETCHQRPNVGMDIQKAPHIRRIKLSLLIFVNIVCKISICMYREINSSIASTNIYVQCSPLTNGRVVDLSIYRMYDHSRLSNPPSKT